MRRLKVLAGGAALAMALALPLAGSAAAQEDSNDGVDALYVGGVSDSKTVTPSEVRGETITAPPVRAQQLPVTGGDILGLVMLGGAAVGTGAVLVRRSRRTS